MIKNFYSSSDIILAESIGEIKKFKILEWTVENLKKDKKEFPVIQLSVMMKVTAIIPEVKSDTNYQITAKLNKSVFFEGDRINLMNLQVTQDSHLYLFSMTSDKVYPITPNNKIDDLSLKAEESIVFPTQNMELVGVKLIASTGGRKGSVYEQLLVVASKRSNSIFDNFVKSNQAIDIQQFTKELLRIPLNERTMKIIDYEIRSN